MYLVNWVLFLIAVSNFFLPGVFYDLKCPHRSHRGYRQNLFCNKTHPEYLCLTDFNLLKDAELCEKEIDFQRPGYKMVLRGNIDGEKCARERYQPIRYFNTDGRYCLFQKSMCNEEGQITVVKGSSKSDSKCICDYTNGYALVSKTSNKCYCSPSEEDCSCYLKYCPNRHDLSPDYQCVLKEDFIEDSLGRHYHCTRILKRIFSVNNMKGKKQLFGNHDNMPGLKRRYDSFAVMCIIQTIVMIVLSILGILCTMHKMKTVTLKLLNMIWSFFRSMCKRADG